MRSYIYIYICIYIYTMNMDIRSISFGLARNKVTVAHVAGPQQLEHESL